MSLIGFLAKKRAGKDTCGDYLVKKLGYKSLSFAGPLKEACSSLFNFNNEQLYGDLKEVVDPAWGISPRRALQFVGTDLFRNHIGELLPEVGNGFWTTCLKVNYLKQIKANPDAKFVITDVRFQNEVDLIHELGGKVVKIERPISHNSQDTQDTQDTHSSEDIDHVIGYNCTLVNDGTLDDLYNKVDCLIPEL